MRIFKGIKVRNAVETIFLSTALILGALTSCDVNPNSDVPNDTSSTDTSSTEYSSDTEPSTSKTEDVPTERQAVTLKGFSENGYNVLLWDAEHAMGIYAIYRSDNGGDFEKIDEEENQNFCLDYGLDENAVYVYYIEHANSREKSDEVSVTTTLDVPEGLLAYEIISDLKSDHWDARIFYQEGNWNKYVSKDFSLSADGEKGSTLTWESSNDKLIKLVDAQGVVTRPKGKPSSVALTAVLQNGEYVMRKSFDLSVAPQSVGVYQEITLEDLKELNNGESLDVVYDEDGWAEYTPNKITVAYDEDGNISRIKGNISSFPVLCEEDTLMVVRNLQGLLNIGDIENELPAFHFSSSSDGMKFGFSQYYNGLKMTNAGITIFVDIDGNIKSVGSSYVPNFSMDTTPKLSAEEAEQIVIPEYGSSITGATVLGIEHYKSTSTSESTSKLAWTVYSDNGRVIVNANTGEIIYDETKGVS